MIPCFCILQNFVLSVCKNTSIEYMIHCMCILHTALQKKDFDHVRAVMKEVVASRDNLLVSPRLIIVMAIFSFN